MSTVNDFLLKLERCYREYDATTFVGNSSNILRGTKNPVHGSFSLNMHSASLVGVEKSLCSIYVNGKEFREFVDSVKVAARFNTIGRFQKLRSTDITFHFGYLKDYLDNCNIITEKLLNNIDKNEIDKITDADFMTDKAADAAKRQIVRSSLNIHELDINDMLSSSVSPSIVYTLDYIQNSMIPFIDSFNKSKEDTVNVIHEMLSCIEMTRNLINGRRSVIETICKKNPDFCTSLNRLNAAMERRIYDVISFVTYSILLKIDYMMQNVRICNQVIEAMQELQESVQELVSAGMYKDTVVSDDIGALADGLVKNNISAYDALASNIWNFHKSALLPRFAGLGTDDPLNQLISEIEKYEYQADDYNNALEILTTISAALDIISASSDDYLIVCDDIIEKSGLNSPIDVRYQKIVELFATPDYVQNADALPYGNFPGYMTALNEVYNFSKNIKTISDSMSDVFKKIDLLEERYTNNINQEYKNLSTIQELRVFLKDLKDQYGNLCNEYARTFYARLKNIGRYLESNLVKFSSSEINNGDVSESGDEDVIDFEKEAMSILLEYEEEYTDLLMSELMLEHNKLWIRKIQHLDVIQEVAEQPVSNKSTVNNQTSSDSASQTSNQLVKSNNQASNAVSDANAKRSIAEKLKALQEKLKARFDEMINKFRQNMNNRVINESAVFTEAAVRYTDWIQNNENALMNRSYSNVTLNILPYEAKMPFNQVMTEVTKFKNLVNTLRPGDVANLKTDADIFNKLYASYGVGPFNSETSIADCKSASSSGLTKYFKVGKSPLDMVSYSNGELKTLMNQIVSFCKKYYETDQERLLKELQNIQKTVSTLSSQFITESVNEIYGYIESLYTEAEDNNQKSTTPTVTDGNASTNQNTTNGTTKPTPVNSSSSMTPSNMIQTVHECTALYSGAILNAMRDRVSDYFKAMQSLVPKNKPTQNQELNQQQNTNQ